MVSGAIEWHSGCFSAAPGSLTALKIILWVVLYLDPRCLVMYMDTFRCCVFSILVY
jgi:hypothetical protein